MRSTMRMITLVVLVFAWAIGTHAQTQTQTTIKCEERADCRTSQKAEAANPDGETKLDKARFKSFKGGYFAKAVKADPPAPAEPSNADNESSLQQSPADEAQALAKKLANPVASLISLPFQNNFDFGMGPNRDGVRYTLNVQPVIPIRLNENWNLISRTIVPIIAQTKVVGTTSQFGLGDTVQTFLVSPNKAKPFIWGLGPQFLIPTGTNNYIRSQKFGMGPSVLLMQQEGQWSYGILATHMWSVAGSSRRASVNLTYLQPFVAYTTKTAWTYTFNTESTYDWTGNAWSVPIHAQVTKLVKLGKQRVSVGGALRCWANSPAGGPRNCGFRLLFTPLFPKK